MYKLIIGLLFLFYPVFLSGKLHVPDVYSLKHVTIDAYNFASLQRGAKYFMNFCSGCHSLRFMRYNQLAVDLKIIHKLNSATNRQRLNKSLIFTEASPNDIIKPNLSKKDALRWFGKYPPDLSLITRTRGPDWLYHYLLGFYQDKMRPFGVNNKLVKNTNMPNPLTIVEKNVTPKFQISKINNNLPLKTNNHVNNLSASRINYGFFSLEEVVADLVNFLAYISDPSKIVRKSLGIQVVSFLIVFLCLAYFLKKQIWKSIK